jgi:hypothetical protein
LIAKNKNMNIFYIFSSIAVENLEPEVRKRLQALPNPPTKVYFNKGL